MVMPVALVKRGAITSNAAIELRSAGYTVVYVEDQGDNAVVLSDRTLRDDFAIDALQGLLASANTTENITFEAYSKCAYHHADAMIKERNK